MLILLPVITQIKSTPASHYVIMAEITRRAPPGPVRHGEMIAMQTPHAKRMDSLQPSTIREILKVALQPEMISFAGGLPAPELFPVPAIDAACRRVLAEEGTQALQYGPSEGYPPLRQYLVEEMHARGVPCAVENILITNGSQQGLDLLAKVFLDPGDAVLTESPTYLAAIQAFQSYEARFVPVPTDDHGLIPEALPALIERHRPEVPLPHPQFPEPERPHAQRGAAAGRSPVSPLRRGYSSWRTTPMGGSVIPATISPPSSPWIAPGG